MDSSLDYLSERRKAKFSEIQKQLDDAGVALDAEGLFRSKGKLFKANVGGVVKVYEFQELRPFEGDIFVDRYPMPLPGGVLFSINEFIRQVQAGNYSIPEHPRYNVTRVDKSFALLSLDKSVQKQEQQCAIYDSVNKELVQKGAVPISGSYLEMEKQAKELNVKAILGERVSEARIDHRQYLRITTERVPDEPLIYNIQYAPPDGVDRTMKVGLSESKAEALLEDIKALSDETLEHVILSGIDVVYAIIEAKYREISDEDAPAFREFKEALEEHFPGGLVSPKVQEPAYLQAMFREYKEDLRCGNPTILDAYDQIVDDMIAQGAVYPDAGAIYNFGGKGYEVVGFRLFASEDEVRAELAPIDGDSRDAMRYEQLDIIAAMTPIPAKKDEINTNTEKEKLMENNVNVRVFPSAKADGKVKGSASIDINGLVAIKDVLIIDGGTEKGLFVSMPAEYSKGKYYDLAHPITSELAHAVSKSVLAEYARIIPLSTEERKYTNMPPQAARDTSSVPVSARVWPFENPKGSKAANASITIGNVAIKGVSVIEGANGPFVSMPQKKKKDGEYRDVAYPLTKELLARAKEAVLVEYKEANVAATLGADAPTPQQEQEKAPTTQAAPLQPSQKPATTGRGGR